MEKISQNSPTPEDWREIRAVWKGSNNFRGINAKGNQVEIASGSGEGHSPMELLLIGLAGCTGLDIVSILEKKRKHLERFELQVRGLRRQEHPRIYTRIHVTYEVWGDDLDVASVEQAIQLSEDKYCSASAMLGAVAEIESSYTIHATHAGGKVTTISEEVEV